MMILGHDEIRLPDPCRVLPRLARDLWASGAGGGSCPGGSVGGCVRFRRGLERVFADERAVLHRAEEVLRAGGVVVAAFTGGDAARKERAAEVLKLHGGQEVRYWGEWIIGRL